MRQRAETRSSPIRVRLSRAERQLAEKAALVNRQNVSEFLRDALLSAAGDCLERRTMVTILRLPPSDSQP
jgi:uncharacterized protein (DUF1778 family)